MNELPLEGFVHAVRATHGAEAQLVKRVQVTESFEGETVWEGEVLVFDLTGHPTALLGYCWEVDGKVTTVLHQPPVDSPLAAARAAILAAGENKG